MPTLDWQSLDQEDNPKDFRQMQESQQFLMLIRISDTV